MRRALTVAGLTVLTVAAMAVGVSQASAQTPTQDSVVGTGTAGFPYEIDVRSGPSGENPTGQLLALDGAGDVFFGGPPTCLAVRDNIATMNIRDELGSFGFGIVTVQITDAAIDRASVALGRQPDDCSPLTSPIVDASIISGDFVVTDAPPLPTTKDQCKNGGWQTYGIFNNQGDCVSFVVTGGRNEPSGP